ncbi:MAG: pirin family protein [Marinilabiliales bacterium]|nr:pirin family protein [Marinilabiliales bacterium]
MTNYRKISRIIHGTPTSDGAGVKLTRIFGFYEQGLLDPFLMLDFFGTDNPNDYIAGFPWHPHRGMETVTYMLDGSIEHSDSMGNSGVIGRGDIQWMTAGSGIIHQEMPKIVEGRLRGFQLWVNLPAARKMVPPRYQDIPAAAIPVVTQPDGSRIKVLAGKFGEVTGPVTGIFAEPDYLDLEIPAGGSVTFPFQENHTAFVYLYEGSAIFGGEGGKKLRSGQGALLGSGEAIWIGSEGHLARMIFIGGQPIGEPIAWRGPVVMNTEAELNQAFQEIRSGQFVKEHK